MSRRNGSRTRRTLSFLLAGLLLALSFGLLTGAGGLFWADRTQREAGHVWSALITDKTSGFALTSDEIHLDTTGLQWMADQVLGTVRLHVEATGDATDLFVGVGRSSDVAAYLSGVAHRQVGGIGQDGHTWLWFGPGVTSDHSGGPPAALPGDVDIWLTQSTGSGDLSVNWPLVDGDWTVVVMRADGQPGVAAAVRTGASATHLLSLAGGLAILGIGLLSLGGRLIARSTSKPDIPRRGTSARADDRTPDGSAASRVRPGVGVPSGSRQADRRS